MNKTTAIVGALTALVAMMIASPDEASGDDRVWVDMPLCQFEDGNPDGKTCMWIDPDTGKGYVSLSENYWGLQEEI